METKVEDKWRLWVDACPLRLWKERKGIFAYNEFASRLGVTTITANSWLLGLTIPRADRMARILKVTGITKDEMMKWFNARP
jgi:transcriptional regulator with XRE-family HTH domain